MKILYVSNHWENNTHHSFYSGYQRLVEFMKKHHDITILTWGKENKKYIDNDKKIIIIKARNMNVFQKRFILSKEAKNIEKNYDIIHCLQTGCTYHLNKELKYITTLHNSFFVSKYNKLKPKIYMLLKYLIFERRAFNRAARIIVVSKNLLKLFSKKQVTKTIFIPHGIDINFWHPIKNNINLKKELLKNRFKNIILCVGSHGVDFELLQYTIKKFPSILFILVGSNRYFNYPNVIIKTNISDLQLRDLYQISDVFFRPVKFSTANNAILEAMAMKKTIVTTKVEGISDYLSDKSAYFINNKNNINIMKSAIKDEEARSSQAYKQALTIFNWDIIAKKINNLYETVLMNK